MNRKTKENDVEKRLCETVRLAGGEAPKLQFVGMRGAPDRLVLIPCGYGQNIVQFIECKRPKGGRLSELQKYWREKIILSGGEYYVIDTIELVDLWRFQNYTLLQSQMNFTI